MPKRNWGVLAAFAGLAALICAAGFGAYLGALYGPEHKHYDAVGSNATSGNTYEGVSESLPDLAGIPDPVERAIANPQPHSGQDHEKRDLAAQEGMAVWAFYMAMFAGLTVVVTGLGTFYIAKQVKLTQEAVDDTSEATAEMAETNRLMRADQRAWVEVNISPNKITFTDKQIAIHYEATLKNIGRSVATGIVFECVAFVFGQANETAIPEFFQEEFETLSLRQTRDLLPNSEATIGSVAHIRVNQLNGIRDGGGREIFTVVMAAKAGYHASEDQPTARTSNSLNLWARTSGAFRYHPSAAPYEGKDIRTRSGRFSRVS
jgi:hypothetical protein